MIKTHRPRGYFWTHASAFQQTEQFRAISYDDCVSLDSRTGLNDGLSEGERQSKRRRIERLADDFLNGKPLFVSSARPCPEQLCSTICSNARSSNQPNLDLPDLNISHDSTLLWQDVEDPEDIIRKFSRSSKDDKSDVVRDDVCPPEDLASRDEQSNVHGRAGARSLRARNASGLTAGPSEEALRQAAALRARRGQRPNSDVMPVQAGALDRNLCPQHLERPASEPKPSSQWLSRRKSSAIRVDAETGEDSLDELRLSRVETPASPLRNSKQSNLSQPMRRLALSRALSKKGNAQNESDNIEVTPRVEETWGARWPNQKEDETRNETNSYHTAPEETEISHDNSMTENAGDVAENSQCRLLRSQGFDETARTSWKPVNQSSPVTKGDVSLHQQSAARRTRRAASTTSQVSVEQASSSNRRQPERRSKRQIKYRTEQPSLSEPSPFRWRKRVAFPSSGDIVVGANPTPCFDPSTGTSQSAPATPAMTTGPPPGSLDVSVERENDPVVSRSANAAEDKTEKRTRLSETWIGTQAMLYRAQQDLISSPEKSCRSNDVVENQDTDDHQRSSAHSSQNSDRGPLKQLSQEPAMPSTQVLLGEFGGFSTVKKPWRGALRESIDSPTVLLRGALASSKQSDSLPDPESCLSGDQPQKRRSGNSSGLRFSISSVDSPLQSTNLNRPPASTTPETQKLRDWSTTELATTGSILKRSHPTGSLRETSPIEQTDRSVGDKNSSEKEASESQNFSTTASLPSFQAAQAHSSIRREETDLEQTIDDFTADLLNTTDMDGVLSQVG